MQFRNTEHAARGGNCENRKDPDNAIIRAYKRMRDSSEVKSMTMRKSNFEKHEETRKVNLRIKYNRTYRE